MTPSSYTAETFGRDFLASIVVFLVALPLCMGISIASGMPPTAGIITGIVGGIIVGVDLGSGDFRSADPRPVSTVLVWQLVQQFGLEMLGVIVLFAGLIQLVAGLLKLGQWFRAVSPAVINGMLAGIGVLIFASQFHVMLDYKPIGTGIQNLMGIPATSCTPSNAGDHHLVAGGIGIADDLAIVLWGTVTPKSWRMFPAPLVGVLVAIVATAALGLQINYVNVPDNIWSVDDIPDPRAS